MTSPIRTRVVGAVAIGMLLVGAGCSSTQSAPESTPESPSAPTPSSATATSTPSSSASTSSPASTASASSTAGPGLLPKVGHSRDITFHSGPDTLYGTYLEPDVPSGTRVPGALIISGSGPTDRNGNDARFTHLDTNRNLARALAADGVASFRYDKLGSGKTGLASHKDGKGITFQLFLDEALSAYQVLARQPHVNPKRLMVVGHSEGALFALLIANKLDGQPKAPHALVLVSPASRRYFDIITEQLHRQVKKATQAGQISNKDGKHLLSRMRQIVHQLRSTGHLSGKQIPAKLQSLFSPTNVRFLTAADKYDPADLARRLGDMPVLVLHGGKDLKITTADVDHLMHGLATDSHARRVTLPNANHMLKVIPGKPNPAKDYTNPDLRFSAKAVHALKQFVHKRVEAR